jgi:hypothetical protein
VIIYLKEEAHMVFESHLDDQTSIEKSPENDKHTMGIIIRQVHKMYDITQVCIPLLGKNSAL